VNGKSVLKSKTFYFNLIVLAVGVATIFGFAEHTPSAEAQESIDAVVVFVAAAAPLINILLRLATNSAVSIFGKSLVKPITFGDVKRKSGVQ
jgi:hypothetical protein